MDVAEVDLRAVVQQHAGPLLGRTDADLALDVLHFRADVFHLDRLAQQLFAEIGVGDRDQGDRPLLHALAVQVGDAVLGDDVVNVAAGGDDARPGAQLRDDARDLAVLGGRGHGDDGLPPGARAAPRLKSTWPPMPE